MLPVKGIKLMIISVLLASLLMPFTVYAETLQNHVEGINVWTDRIDYIDISTTQQSNIYRNYCNVNVEIVLDAEYVGWQNLGISVKYWNYSTSNSTWSQSTQSVSGNYYVNGSKINIVVPITFVCNNVPYYQAGNGTGQSLPNSSSQVTLSVTNTGNIVEYSELNTLIDIYNILLDVQQNVSDSEDILKDISLFRQYNIPFESFNFVHYMIHEFDVVDIMEYYNYQYPVFSINTNDEVFKFFGSRNYTYRFIFYVNQNLTYNDRFINNFTFSSGSMSNIKYTPPSFESATRYGAFYTFDFNTTTSGDITLTYTNVLGLQRTEIIPIYFGYADNKNISTDFALLWGLSNQLIDDLNIIAQGTNQSNSASSDLQGNTSDFETATDQYYTIENTYNNNMNTQLQNIDTSTGLSGFGGNFLTSANWVRVQYQNLTNGNPFGSLVTYGLTLGLALLLLGKVFL